MINSLRFLFVLVLIPVTGLSQHWEPVGVFNMYPTVICTDSAGNRLYSGGYFTAINGEQRWGIASWNNLSWDSLGLGIDYDSVSSQPQMVRGFLQDAGYLYVVGSFRRAGVINTNAIARWDGATWDSVPGCRIPDYQSITDIVKINGEIYICGSFDSVGNLPVHGLAKWNGIAWQAVANNYGFTTPPAASLYKMQFYHGRLYVSGYFRDPNGNTCRLARWDGWNWHFMTNEVQGGIADIWDMEVYQDKLYIAGLFFESAGNVANCLQSWNDTTWCAVGGSVQIQSNQNPVIRDLHVHNNKLYCAGNFEMIGGIASNCIAIWDGTDWCSLGSSFDMGGLTQIEFHQDTMYVIGGFWSINGDSIAYIAKWIGGNYVDTCGHLTTDISDNDTYTNQISIFPNPSSNHITITTSASNTSNTIIEILDATGKRIDQISFQNSSTLSINCSGYAEGIYLLRMLSDGECVATEKLLIAR